MTKKDKKSSNPKDALASDRLPIHLWPESATAFGCIALFNGMLKYGRANWRVKGVRPSVYIAACKRHLNDWFDGEDFDPEDGVHNLGAAIACLAIIIDAMCSGKLNDDRNIKTGAWRKSREMMEPSVLHLKKLHKGSNPKHFTIKDNHE